MRPVLFCLLVTTFGSALSACGSDQMLTPRVDRDPSLDPTAPGPSGQNGTAGNTQGSTQGSTQGNTDAQHQSDSGSDSDTSTDSASTGDSGDQDTGWDGTWGDGGLYDTGWGDGTSEDTGTTDDTSSPDDSAPALPATAGELVISELMIDASSVTDAHGEWVELYNGTSHSVIVGDLLLGDWDVDSWALDTDLEVASGDYVVICADADPTTNGGVGCDATFHYNTWGEGFALANTGDEVVLMDADGSSVDTMTFDETQVSVGASLGLDPDHLDAADNNTASNWCEQGGSLFGGDAGTPGRANDDC